MLWSASYVDDFPLDFFPRGTDPSLMDQKVAVSFSGRIAIPPPSPPQCVFSPELLRLVPPTPFSP